MNVKKVVALAGFAALVTACSSDSKVDIGDGATSQGLSAYAANWDGYAEAYSFGDESDRVRVTLDDNGQGHIRLGDTPLLPTPSSAGDPAPPFGVETDFAYAVAGRLENESRLRFDVELQQRYEAWCQLQTPVLFSPTYPSVYACSRQIGVQLSEDGSCTLLDTQETVDCSSHYACQYSCACTEETCSASPNGPVPNPPPHPAATFDGALSGDAAELTGTLLLYEKRIPVRLRRQ